MKKYSIAIIILIILSACGPSTEQIARAIEETQAAQEESYTATPSRTNTPAATDTPAATETPKSTNTPRPTSTKRPTNTPELGTYSNPFPFGSTASLTMTSEGEKVDFHITIEEVIRGDDAWSTIKQANRFNDPPPDGYEAILIKIYVKNTSSTGFLSLDKYGLALATKGNVIDYGFYSPCCLDSAGFVEFDAKLNPSGEHSGWYAIAVHVDEDSPMLVIGADYSGRGGIYFELP